MPQFFSQPATFWAEEHREDPYESYFCRSEYFWNSGKILLPIAVAGQDTDPPTPGQQNLRTSAAVVQVSAPWGRKVVTFGVKRKGVKPDYPQVVQTANEILASASLVIDEQELESEGIGEGYQITGAYVYHVLQPWWVHDTLQIPVTPYDDTPLASFDSTDADSQLSP